MDRTEYTPFATSYSFKRMLEILADADIQRIRERSSDVGESETYLRSVQYEMIYQFENKGPLLRFVEPKIVQRLAIFIGEFCLSITKNGWWNPAYFNVLIAEIHLAQQQIEAHGIKIVNIPSETQEYYGEDIASR